MYNLTRTIAVLSGLLIASIPLAHANDSTRVELMAAVNQWYAIIGTTKPTKSDLDRANARLDELLADNVKIVLEDLNVAQSKAEFIESFEGFTEALEGGRLAFRPDGDIGETEAAMLACYVFTSNSLLNRETFVIVDGQISAIRQTPIGDDCADF